MSVHHGRISLKPTRLALMFALLFLVMLGAAINYGNNLSFVVAFTLIGIGINAAWQTRRQLTDLTLTTQPPAPRHAGEPGQLKLTLRAIDRPRPGLYLAADDNPIALALEAEQETPVSLSLRPRKRGRHQLPPIELETSHPLGLWQARLEIIPTDPQWVYPRPAGDQPLPPPIEEGADTNLHRPGDEDFHSLRDYQPGDPLARIAFKRSAIRDGKLLTKTFMGQPGGGQVLDLNYQHAEGDPEQRLSQLTRWLLQAEQTGQPWQLTLPGQVPDLTSLAPTARRRALEKLALYRPEATHG